MVTSGPPHLYKSPKEKKLECFGGYKLGLANTYVKHSKLFLEPASTLRGLKHSNISKYYFFFLIAWLPMKM